jgi:hypothetical protein
MNQYVYHFRPKEMSGDFLIPLNSLQKTHPVAYVEHVKKYKGREELLQETIPILDCLWNDVLHISPINPQVIIDTWKKESLYEHARIPKAIEVYKIPVNIIKEETTVCFQSFNFDFNNYDPSLEKYWEFRKADFLEQKAVDLKQLEIWKNDFKNGRTFFWYSHTTHVLAKQQIDTRSCELIVCQ